ncbi:MAG: PSD1 and planctomycete cytochrome C domain-containing protein [Planctomycetaceae bacterium]
MTMQFPLNYGLLLASVVFFHSVSSAQESQATAESNRDRDGLDFFEAKIRPMLIKHCYECHSAEAVAKNKLKGGLFLDTRAASLKGGESGPAVVPGKPDESLLISALKHESFEMPPAGKLPDEIISHFTHWIKIGAPDPREGDAIATAEIDIEQGRQHWAFQRLQKFQLPTVKNESWVRNDIDRYVLARQEEKGIAPNPVASYRTLIRRVYFDLIGLPPSPEAVGQFIREAELDFDSAYSNLLDQLLKDEHFGERWARHWLDVVRFAESNGYAFDKDRPNAWHYRDWVIQAFNQDLPYDQFLNAQLAGDIGTNIDVKTTPEFTTAKTNLAATGFLVAGPFTSQQTQKERERSRYEQLDDIVSTLGTSVLGLTVGCARCHSHKFDPLPKHDYYRFVANFAEVGSADVQLNSKPEEFLSAMKIYNDAHTPLASALNQYVIDTLPKNFEQWVKSASPTPETGLITQSPWYSASGFQATDAHQAWETPFEPEQGVDLTTSYREGTIVWNEQKAWNDEKRISFEQVPNTAQYSFRKITSPVAQTASLSFSTTSNITIWVNQSEVLRAKEAADKTPSQYRLRIPLKQGENQLLIKSSGSQDIAEFTSSIMTRASQPLANFGSWFHLGPFKATNHNEAFGTVYPPEDKIDLEATYEGGLQWEEHADWEDGTAHNDLLSGENSANFLYRVIESSSPQPVHLSLGSDDGIQVWVNGRKVLNKNVGRNDAKADQEKLTVQLSQGRNEILLKISNGGGKTGFYFKATHGKEPDDVRNILALSLEKRNAGQNKRLLDWYKGYDQGFLALEKPVKFHELSRPSPNNIPVFAAKTRGSTYQFGEDTYKVYHLRRGNVDNKESLADPGFLQVLTDAEKDETFWTTDANTLENPLSGRETLANWLTDEELGAGHLAARVLVNRLWYHHFGRGLVATPSDFGTRGELPSHPHLLDFLAQTLIENQWRMKPIHKLIMSSATYMQGNAQSDTGLREDPENLLIWRRASKRLEAEIIRDSILTMSGTIDLSHYGKGTLDSRSNRRSIYFTVKRGQLIPLLKLFDAPDAMQGIATREQSTVAPQALALLNSPLIRDYASNFAAQVRPNADIPNEQVITSAYELALSRPASPDELTTMNQFIQSQTEMRGGDANAQQLAIRDFCHLILCMNEFVYID